MLCDERIVLGRTPRGKALSHFPVCNPYWRSNSHFQLQLQVSASAVLPNGVICRLMTSRRRSIWLDERRDAWVMPLEHCTRLSFI